MKSSSKSWKDQPMPLACAQSLIKVSPFLEQVVESFIEIRL
jgi:hypothetical protein